MILYITQNQKGQNNDEIKSSDRYIGRQIEETPEQASWRNSGSKVSEFSLLMQVYLTHNFQYRVGFIFVKSIEIAENIEL